MSSNKFNSRGSWYGKFANAFRGIGDGIRGQSSFTVHLVVAVAVAAAAAVFRLGGTQWCLLLLCIGLVMTAELFNSSLESIAKTIDRSENAELGRALDIASGAVLVAAITAAIVGLVVLVPHVG